MLPTSRRILRVVVPAIVLSSLLLACTGTSESQELITIGAGKGHVITIGIGEGQELVTISPRPGPHPAEIVARDFYMALSQGNQDVAKDLCSNCDDPGKTGRMKEIQEKGAFSTFEIVSANARPVHQFSVHKLTNKMKFPYLVATSRPFFGTSENPDWGWLDSAPEFTPLYVEVKFNVAFDDESTYQDKSVGMECPIDSSTSVFFYVNRKLDELEKEFPEAASSLFQNSKKMRMLYEHAYAYGCEWKVKHFSLFYP